MSEVISIHANKTLLEKINLLDENTQPDVWLQACDECLRERDLNLLSQCLYNLGVYLIEDGYAVAAATCFTWSALLTAQPHQGNTEDDNELYYDSLHNLLVCIADLTDS